MSTFSVFRRNQKTWLAVLGVLTMLSFVFIPTLEQCNRHFVAGNQDYFKTKAFGNLSYNQFQQESKKLNTIFQAFQNNFYGLNEDMVAMTWLKAKYAEKMGFVVSDHEIRNYINDAFSNSVDSYHDALKKINMSPATFEEGLKEIILADKYQRYCCAGLSSPNTIEQLWSQFCTLSRSATISVIPVRAEDFISKVSSPSKDQVKAFFEANKKRTPNKKAGVVGFKSPAKMRIQYFVYEKPSIGNAPADESAAPLQDSIQLDDSIPVENAPADAAPADAAPADAAPADAAPADAAPSDAAPADAAPADAAPADAAPADTAPSDAAPAENAPAENAPAANAPAENAPVENAPAESSTDARSQSPFRLVADETVTTEPAQAETTPEEPKHEEVQIQDPYDAQTFRKLVQTDLSTYKKELNQFEFKNSNTAEKPVLKFSDETKAYMEKCNIQLKELELMDLETLAEQPIAKTEGFLFNEKTFTAIECRDLVNEYIVWSSEYIHEDEPKELTEELTTQVEKAWKFEEAKKKAFEAAQKSAEDCAKANKLTGSTAPIEVKDFARYQMTIQGFPSPVDPSTYTQLENIGEDFCNGVFQLRPGDIKAFPNRNRTVFYVTQLKSFEPGDEDLRDMFQNLKSNPMYMYILQQLNLGILNNDYDSWQKSLFDEAGASFVRREQMEE